MRLTPEIRLSFLRPKFTCQSVRLTALYLTITGLLQPSIVRSQTMKAPDITKDPTLYVFPYAHLDTQWRWEFPQTISEYLLKTMRMNFDYIDRYPHYVFNWTGANRYRLMKEYFPADYARLQQYVLAGRWYPAGSSVEEGDVNLPSAEGIFRQILYGNEYFRKDFGKASAEYMLPDCFGFPASLPSILAHAGVKGFSTQKLSAQWQPALRSEALIHPSKRRKAFPSMLECGWARTERESSPLSILAGTAATCIPTSARSPRGNRHRGRN
jgi:alpha-mannosidase